MGVKLRHRTLKDGSRSYYLHCSAGEERWKEGLSVTSRKGYHKEVAEELEQIRARRSVELVQGVGVSVYKSRQCFAWYFTEYVAEHYPKNRAAKASLKQFLGLWTRLPFSSLNETVCDKFRRHLNKAYPKGGTAGIYWGYFKAALRQAKTDNYLAASPATDLRMSTRTSRIKEVLNSEEFSRLTRTPCGNEQVKRAFLLSCVTGMRPSEIRRATPEHLWEKDGQVFIHVKQTKGSAPKPKDIPLSAFALELLGAYEPGSTVPFFRLPNDNVCNGCIGTWRKAAGITKYITLYCARHSFTTELVAAGVDLRTVIGLLGHSSTQHIIRYARQVDENKINAIQNLNFKPE